LLTPITKAWCTELVNEIASLGIQVHGGMGFIEETGVAQHYRDARITAIYEGTTAIQANDLVGRKLMRDSGAGFNALMSEMDATLSGFTDDSAIAKQFAKYKSELQTTAQFILESSGSHAKFEGAISFNFLMQMGYVCGAWYMLRSYLIAQAKLDAGEGDPQFFANKQLSATFFMNQMLPRATSYGKAIVEGADIGCELSPAAFG
jgi:hypothetical protein